MIDRLIRFRIKKKVLKILSTDLKLNFSFSLQRSAISSFYVDFQVILIVALIGNDNNSIRKQNVIHNANNKHLIVHIFSEIFAISTIIM